MASGSKRKEQKAAINLQRTQDLAKKRAAPLLDVYEEMGPAFDESLSLAMKPRGIRRGYETALRGMRPQFANMSTGSRAALMSRMNQEFMGEVGRQESARGNQLLRLADFARGSGLRATQMEMDPLRAKVSFFQQGAARDRAREEAKEAAEAEMWRNVGELGVEMGVDVVMGMATGGATVPLSAAKWAGKGAEYAGQGAQHVSDQMAEYRPESDMWKFFSSEGGGYGTPVPR